MAVTINASTTAGLVTSADTSGNLDLQAGGVTKIAVTSAGANIVGTLTVNGVAPASGKVLQVVSTSYSTVSSTTSTSYIDSGITATITPTSATSKLYITVSIPHWSRNGATNCMLYLNLCKNGTQIAEPINAVGYSGATSGEYAYSTGFFYYDSPASTSALTYKIQYKAYAGTVILQQNNSPSVLTIMEIAA